MAGSTDPIERIINAERELAAARVALLERNTLPEPESDFITFSLQHGPYEPSYTYVAYRAPNCKWHLTGRGSRVFTWRQLVAWLRSRAYVSPIKALAIDGSVPVMTVTPR